MNVEHPGGDEVRLHGNSPADTIAEPSRSTTNGAVRIAKILRSKGWTLTSIASTLNEEEHPTPQGKKYTPTTVRRLLLMAEEDRPAKASEPQYETPDSAQSTMEGPGVPSLGQKMKPRPQTKPRTGILTLPI